MTFYPTPIETYYNGHRFRSRLEARWAVFLDTLGVPYEYEKEGYELPGGLRYLPDFWLPEQDCWMEIKGEPPDFDDNRKPALLAMVTEKPVILFWGDVRIPGRRGDWNGICYFDVACGCIDEWCGCEPNTKSEVCCHDERFDGKIPCCSPRMRQSMAEVNFLWCECFYCGKVGITCNGDSRRLGCDCEGRGYPFSLPRPNYSTERLKAAYVAARSARFEFGETPEPR